MSQILIAPLEVLMDTRLNDPERRVLFALFSFRDKKSDTVWPRVEWIACRSGIGDVTRVSKVTRSLSEKGWLTKKKRGFSGYIQYTLTVPDEATRLMDESNLDCEAKLEDKAKGKSQKEKASQPNLDSQSNLDGDAKSNLDSETKSNLDSESKCRDQSNEQSIEQEGGGASAPPARPVDKSRGTRLPENWQLTPEYLEAALSIRPELSPEAVGDIASGFRDYWIARPGAGGRKADWLATWRNWVRRENRFGSNGGSTPPYQTAHQQRAELADAHLDYDSLTEF